MEPDSSALGRSDRSRLLRGPARGVPLDRDPGRLPSASLEEGQKIGRETPVNGSKLLHWALAFLIAALLAALLGFGAVVTAASAIAKVLFLGFLVLLLLVLVGGLTGRPTKV